MATLSISVLEAANEDGLLTKKLSKQEEIYIHSSVIFANKIIQIIKFNQGIDTKELSKAAGCDRNTLKIYCRFLSELGLIRIEKERKIGAPNTYFL